MVLIFFGILALPLAILRLLFRHRILTWQRVLTGYLLAVLLATDFLTLPLLYHAPQVFLPLLHPKTTWPALLNWLNTVPQATWNKAHQPWGFISIIWLLGHRPAGFWFIQLLWLFLGLPLLHWAWTSGWPSRHREPKAAAVATHGSSRWRQPKEYPATLARIRCASPEGAGVIVCADGKVAWRTRPTVGNPHVLVYGATRSGKSRRIILPTIFTIGHAKESMILTDPKGELHAAASAWLREQGYEVVLIDLLRPARGNRWNPYRAIVRAYEAGDEEEASRLAWEFGNVLAWGEGTANDPIWPQAEESLLAALALGTAIEAPPNARHPATAYRMLSDLGADGGDDLDDWFSSLDPDHPARRAYGTAALSEDRTRSSIYTGTAAHLRLFGDPGVAWLTAESDHDPAEAGRKPMAIFMLVPDEAAARRPIITLYAAQAYSSLALVARENGGALPTPVWFLLDEFGNIGKLPDLGQKLTVSAGRGIRFLLAVQSMAQIDQVYGPQVREIIAGNCDTWIFLRAADEATAKAISAKAGTYTVQTFSRSSRGYASTMSDTESATARPLLTPDEVLRWPLGESLLLQAGQYPARLPLKDLSAWREASRAFTPGPVPQAARVEKVVTWAPEADDGYPGVKTLAAEPTHMPAPKPAPMPAPKPLPVKDPRPPFRR